MFRRFQKYKKNTLLLAGILLGGIILGYYVNQVALSISRSRLDIFAPRRDIYLQLFIPQGEYKKARALFADGTLKFAADQYFSGATLKYSIDGISGECADVSWRAGGQSKRQLPEIEIYNGKKTLSLVSYKVKFRDACLGVKKIKMEYFEDTQTLQKNLSVRELYAKNGLVTPRLSSGMLVTTLGGITSRGMYSFDESLDDDFLEKNLGKEEADGWLFRVNTLGIKSGTLAPLSPEEIDNTVGINSEDGQHIFVYDLKTRKKDLKTGKQKLLEFIDIIDRIKREGGDIARFINMHDIVTLTALNTIVGNIDDYATQGNNYYIFFPKDGGLIRFFGVDFDTINPAQKSRDYMLAHHIHPLYDIVIAHPLYLTTKSILGTVVE